MPHWTFADIPDQSGRLAVVTGTGGLGFEAARALARTGAEVVLAGRDPDKGSAAVARIVAETGGTIRFEQLDLADLGSIAAFAERFARGSQALDLLINNAGVMAPPRRKTTRDGFELQFGTNFLGHFALTAHCLPLLLRSPAARVVSVSSVAHRHATIRFGDLQAEHGYRPFAAYQQSKLAMLMFALELEFRSREHHWPVTSIAAHPGFSRTDLMDNGAGKGRRPSLISSVAKLLLPVLSQPAAAGALPILYAATDLRAEGGGYYGPDGRFEMTGWPGPAKVAPEAKDRQASARLWSEAQALTGSLFPD